jgi:hypothetical protein
MWRYDTNDPASPFHSKIWKWDPKSVTGSLLWEGCAGLWVRSLPGSVGFTNCTGQRHQFSAYPDRERSLACVCLTHLTAQASGYHGGPTDILRGRQADTLQGHVRLGLPDEEATAPGQSASRT